MRKVIGLSLAATVGTAGLLAIAPAQAADMQAPQAQMQPPPPGYYGPPPPVENYPPPPPVAYGYPPPAAYYAPPPVVVVPGPYYGYGPYWGGYPHVAYGYGYGRWHYRGW
jgi:hypothetical protein